MEQVFDSELELELELELESSSSSGCESGWTLYLEHDSNIPHDFSWKKASDADQHHDQEEEEDDDDDDMSMVSDASSGPPHFQEQDEEDDEYGNDNDNDHVFCHPPIMTPIKRRKILKQTSFHSHQDHFQDHDTASSPFSTTSKDLNVCNKGDDNSFDYSKGHSTTYFEMV